MRTATRWGLSLLTGLGILAILLLLVDMRALFGTLERAHWGYLALAAVLDLAVLVLKARRWQVILGGAAVDQPFGPVFEATVLGFWANVVLPARAGDIGRGLYAAKQQNVGKATGIATVALDKAMDAFSLVAIVAPLALVGEIPDGFRLAIQIAVGASAAGFLLLFWLVRAYGSQDPAHQKGRLLRVVVGLAAGMRTVTQGRRFARAYVLAVLSWLSQVAMLAACSAALGFSMRWAEATLVLVGVNLVIFLPGTPGNVGTYHAAVLVTMGLLGFPRAQALGLGLVSHALQVVVLCVLATVVLYGAQSRRGTEGTARRRRPAAAGVSWGGTSEILRE